MPGDPAARHRDRREATRRTLLDAAMRVFSAKGVAATSVDDIVRAAGLAKGTFYLYFATKDEAVDAVAAAMVERVA
ncbi:MAG TPA: helix-turn-helix domain-containing protein, partial [Candidatus Limnocylindrales bacterium]